MSRFRRGESIPLTSGRTGRYVENLLLFVRERPANIERK